MPGSEWDVLGQFLYLRVTALACAVVGDISRFRVLPDYY